MGSPHGMRVKRGTKIGKTASNYIFPRLQERKTVLPCNLRVKGGVYVSMFVFING